MADVFVSYKTEDRARVVHLVAALRAGGLDVWWDQDIPVGGGWRETIALELDIARLCVVAWSESSVAPGGRFVREEAERSAARGAYLGVLIDPVMPPFGFAEWQSADLSRWDGSPGGTMLERFVEQVRARLQNQPAPPPAPPQPRKRRRLVWPWAVGGAFAVAAAVALLLIWAPWRGPVPAETPTAFVNTRLGTIGCSWLQISSVSPAQGGERIALTGIAPAPDAVQASIMSDVMRASLPISEISVEDVAAGPSETCAELDLLRQYRWQGAPRLRVNQPRGALEQTPQGRIIRFEIEVDFANLPPNAILLGLDSVGGVHFTTEPHNLHAFLARYRADPTVRVRGSRVTYQSFFSDDNQGARNVGFVLMTASRPIDEGLVTGIGTRADRDFLTRLNRAAVEGDWQFELALVRCGFEGSITRRRCD